MIANKAHSCLLVSRLGPHKDAHQPSLTDSSPGAGELALAEAGPHGGGVKEGGERIHRGVREGRAGR